MMFLWFWKFQNMVWVQINSVNIGYAMNCKILPKDSLILFWSIVRVSDNFFAPNFRVDAMSSRTGFDPWSKPAMISLMGNLGLFKAHFDPSDLIVVSFSFILKNMVNGSLQELILEHIETLMFYKWGPIWITNHDSQLSIEEDYHNKTRENSRSFHSWRTKSISPTKLK